MSDYLQRYLPEFDEEDMRTRLSSFTSDELLEMLIRAYKEKRLLGKMWTDDAKRLERIRAILAEQSSLLGMPDVPGPDDLRKMME